MKYEGIIIRPPSEAASLILQVTVGCSHNKCTFCPAYKAKQFRVKTLQEIFQDIDEAAAETAEKVRRVFLCDGDPLIIPQETLLSIASRIQERFPRLLRIGVYANAKSILRKSVSELRELQENRLGILYLGLESGDPITLELVKKGVTAEQMIEAAAKVREAGIKLSVTVILGLGGRQRSLLHATETMRVLNKMKPHHVGALTLMLVPETPLYRLQETGGFILPEPFELIQELRAMLAESQLENCLFFSNHASNYLPLKVRLPHDKERVLREIDSIVKAQDERLLTPEFLRAL